MKDVYAMVAELTSDIKWIRKTLDEHNAQTADLSKRIGIAERLIYIGLGMFILAGAMLPFVLSK